MMECGNCEFNVTQKMRHALVTNSCPACGATLLGAPHRHRLSLFERKLSRQDFAQKLDSNDLFDIALFMLLEFFPLDSEKKSASVEPDKAEPDVGEPESEGVEESFDDLRDQIRREMLEEVEAFDEEESDIETKVDRLRQIAKESQTKPSRVMVRRIGS